MRKDNKGSMEDDQRKRSVWDHHSKMWLVNGHRKPQHSDENERQLKQKHVDDPSTTKSSSACQKQTMQ